MKKVINRMFSKKFLSRQSSLGGKIAFCLVFITFFSLDVFSQPPPPPPPNIPIDGGIGWLLAAGLAYGAKKTFDFRKKKE